MSVSEYFKELESQMRRVEIKETNKEKIKIFVSGLRRDIQDQVELYEYSTLENVFTLVLGIEIQLKSKRRAKKSYSPNHYFSHSWKGKDKKKHDKFPSNSHQEPPSKSKSPSDHIHIPLLKDQVSLNVLNVWVTITFLLIAQPKGP